MSALDKGKHAAEKAVGEVKEHLGKASDDESLQAEGRNEQRKADLGNAAEKVKDAFKD